MQIKQSPKWRKREELRVREREADRNAFSICANYLYTHTHTHMKLPPTHTHLACMQKFRFLLRVANWSKRQLAISNWGMARKKPPKLAKNGGRNFGGIDFAKPK